MTDATAGETAAPALAAPVYEPLPQAVVGGIINALINGGLGYALLPAGQTLPLWGLPSLAFDVVAMSFGIAFGTGLAVTAQVRSLERKGRLRPPESSGALRRRFASWPSGVLQRSFNLGVLGVLLFAPLTLLALAWLAPLGFERTGLTVFKTVFGFVEGAVAAPLIGLAAFKLDGAPDVDVS